MKGAGTLALLGFLAALSGIGLVLTRHSESPPGGSGSGRSPHELYIEEAIGLRFKTPAVIQAVSQDFLIAEVEANLDGQFGPGGLARRTRAFELIGLLPTARSLRREMLALETGGVRGWFDDRTGNIFVPEDFDPDDLHDRVELHDLLTRLLLHQHAPPSIGRLPDDEWIARRGLFAAIAESVKARTRSENRETFDLPTTLQTERSALILGLPLYLLHLAELPLEQGLARVFLEARVQTGARVLGDLVQEPPRTTFELFGGDSSVLATPRLPPLSQVQLEESVGALMVQVLLEWLDSYEQARALALLWRGDHYRLYADESGDNVIWICNWATPQAAQRAGEILEPAPNSSDAPAAGRRFRSLIVEGASTIYANCASAESLGALIRSLEIPGSPVAPTP